MNDDRVGLLVARVETAMLEAPQLGAAWVASSSEQRLALRAAWTALLAGAITPSVAWLDAEERTPAKKSEPYVGYWYGVGARWQCRCAGDTSLRKSETSECRNCGARRPALDERPAFDERLAEKEREEERAAQAARAEELRAETEAALRIPYEEARDAMPTRVWMILGGMLPSDATLADVAELTAEKILLQRGLGRKSLHAIKRMLAHYGPLSLGMRREDYAASDVAAEEKAR